MQYGLTLAQAEWLVDAANEKLARDGEASCPFRG